MTFRYPKSPACRFLPLTMYTGEKMKESSFCYNIFFSPLFPCNNNINVIYQPYTSILYSIILYSYI